MFYFDCELLLASANSYICNVVFKSGVKISISKWRYLRCSGQLKVSFEILVTWIPPLSQSATSFVSPNMFFTYLEKKSQISFYHLKQRKSHNQCPASRVFQYRVGSGRVLDKIPGSGSGRGVEIYDRVFPGISFIFGYFRVFRVFPGMSGIFGFFWLFFEHLLRAEKIATKPNWF